MEEVDRFRRLVDETCSEQGIKPPRRVTVNLNPKRRASATAVRVGRMGSGFIVSTQMMVDDLTDDELRVVVRHELAHYRHAEARWAPVQALAGFSPVLVVVYGWPLAHTIGKVETVVLYFASLGAHVLAFKSKRAFEARADRESVDNTVQAQAARRALLKFGTLKERTLTSMNSEEGAVLIDDFESEVLKPPTKSDRLHNAIWGVHPLLRDRLVRYDQYANEKA